MPEDEREGVWDIKRGDKRVRGVERRSVSSRRKGRNRGTDRICWGEGEGVNMWRERRKKRQPALLPVMCLRGKEIGGGMEVLLHENSVQKDLRKGWGGSAI